MLSGVVDRQYLVHLQKTTTIAEKKLKRPPDTNRKIKQLTNSGLDNGFGSY